MAGNIYTYTFTPTAAEVGISRFHAVSVDQSILGFSIAKYTTQLMINVGQCQITPPTTYPTMFACYHSEACILNL